MSHSYICFLFYGPTIQKGEWVMLKIAISILSVLLLTVPAAADWKMSEFMISTWGTPPVADDEEKAKALADAHINVVKWDADKINLCRKYGLKLMVMGATPEMASQLSDNPALWGYYVIDEPEVDKFSGLAKQFKALHKADPDHPAFINLLPRAGKYLQKFIEIIQPEIVSYDYYQWWNGCSETGHFEKLEQHREAALNAGIPLSCCVEINTKPSAEGDPGWACDTTPPSDNAQKLRQSVYTSLAYGVKGIDWFPASHMYEGNSSKLNQCGKDVVAINTELKLLGPILIKLRSVDVFHTPPFSCSTQKAPPDYWVHALGAVLVQGMFKDDEGNDFMMVANRNYQYGRKVILRFQRPVKSVEKFNKQTGEWEPLAVTKEVSKDYSGVMLWALAKLDLVWATYNVPVRWSGEPLFVEFIIKPGDGELLRLQ